MNNTTDVVIVGAGVIGTAIAWRCTQHGLTVTLVDPGAESPADSPAAEPGAWHTAAGMLAPITESHFTETPLLRLNLASAASYPSFARELADVTGAPVGYRESGTLALAWDAADHAALRDLHAFLTPLGLAAELVTGSALRELEPAVAPGLPGGLLAADDHQVDPRQLRAALLSAALAGGAHLITAAAVLRRADDRVVGVETADGSRIDAATTVLAAGAWSGAICADVPVRPIKGQTLRLRREGLPLRHIVRATVKGNPIYVVPRGDGRFVVGASSEEAGFDRSPRAGAVYELLRDAQSVLPELSEAVLDEVCTGLRPGTPDNAPLIGPSGTDGLVLATGHYRNGVLLAPITADAIAALLTEGELPEPVAPFTPARTHSAVLA